MTKVLVVAAHPDDETLGCGGAIARHIMDRDAVFVLTVTDGVGSRGLDGLAYRDAAQARMTEFREACLALGVPTEFAQNLTDARPATGRAAYRDQRLDETPMPDLAAAVVSAVDHSGATLVYTHWRGDLNADHRRVAEAVLVATRPSYSAVRQVLAFEVAETTALGPEPFAPTVYVELSESQLDRKITAVSCYQTERQSWPHPRSVRGATDLARVRGSQVGASAAEAFVLLREIR